MKKVTHRAQRSKVVLQTLKQDFWERKIKNPQLSLRGYARILGLNKSTLSRILNEEVNISKKTASSLQEKLGPLYPDIVPQLHELTGSRLQTYQTLDSIKFNVISDWFYFAVFSLAETDDFIGEKKWIARRLGITENQAQLALNSLLKLDLLQQNTDGRIVATGKSLQTTDLRIDLAVRKQNSQFLDLAKKKLDTMTEKTFHETYFSGVTMAVDRSRLKEANKRIHQFTKKLCSFLEGGTEKNEVYKFSSQLFSLSQDNHL